MNRFCSRIKSINMDHIGIVFALRVVFAVKIWEKTSMIVWTTLCGPDYHTLPAKAIVFCTLLIIDNADDVFLFLGVHSGLNIRRN